MTTIEQITEIIKKSNSIALFAHTNPDGDAIGSCVALCLALRRIGKNAEIFCDTPVSKKIQSFLPQSVAINQRYFGNYDLFIAVDCGDIFRLGEFSGLYSAFINTLTIDHHNSSEVFSKYNYVYQVSATAELIYDVINLLNCKIDSDIATQLYIALSTDTGNFSHPSTTSRCLFIASELAKCDIPISKINIVLYKAKTISYTRLIGRITARMRSYFDDRFCLVYVTQQDLNDFNLGNDASSDIVNYCIDVETAVCGASVFEYKQNVYKVSMRGKNFVVRDICEFFGGGGHDFASGCQICGFLEDVIDKLIKAVGDKLL